MKKTASFTQNSQYTNHREFGAIPFGSLAAKLTILPVFKCLALLMHLFSKLRHIANS